MAESKTVRTAPFRISPGVCVKEIMLIYARRNLVWIILPVVASLIAGASYDGRFFYISAMLIFLIIPMIMVPVYLSHALKPEINRLVKEHYVEFSGDSVTTIFVSNEDEPEAKLPEPTVTSYDDLTYLKKKNGFMIIGYAPGHYNLMMIPAEAFSVTGTMAEASELIYDYGDRNRQN